MTYALAYPLALLLIFSPILVWYVAPPRRAQVTAIRIPFFRQITEAAGVQGRAAAAIPERSWLQISLACLVWALVVLALAKPERLGEPIVIESAGRDIILALDISGSMDERDFIAPDGQRQQRLEAVKSVMSTFISERDSDRMALVIFGTRAFVQAPFTDDLASLQGFLDQIVVGLAGPNTALGDAIGLSLRTFEGSDVEERVLILLSDGADTSSRMDPVNAAAAAAERAVTIHTIGVGDPAASGEDRVDLAALEAISQTTGGAYFFASDQAALQDVYAQIDALNPRIAETSVFRPRESLVHLPLSLALIVVLGAISYLGITQRNRIET